jgi:TPR repeat protein
MKKLIVCIFALAAAAALMGSCTTARWSDGWAQNDPNAQYEQGEIYRKNKDYQKAMQWYLKAAEQGHVAAQNDLGLMYTKGEGVNRRTIRRLWIGT